MSNRIAEIIAYARANPLLIAGGAGLAVIALLLGKRGGANGNQAPAMDGGAVTYQIYPSTGGVSGGGGGGPIPPSPPSRYIGPPVPSPVYYDPPPSVWGEPIPLQERGPDASCAPVRRLNCMRQGGELVSYQRDGRTYCKCEIPANAGGPPPSPPPLPVPNPCRPSGGDRRGCPLGETYDECLGRCVPDGSGSNIGRDVKAVSNAMSLFA